MSVAAHDLGQGQRKFKFHYPERGRKLLTFVLQSLSKVQILLPRKGTETIDSKMSEPNTITCSNSITPKGDGNHRFQRTFKYTFNQFKFHHPERGRKLGGLENYENTPEALSVQIPLPRKGTETQQWCPSVKLAQPRVQIPLPRKGTETLLGAGLRLDSQAFKFHYPERGRKHCYRFACGTNDFVQIPLPRKGTETQ